MTRKPLRTLFGATAFALALATVTASCATNPDAIDPGGVHPPKGTITCDVPNEGCPCDKSGAVTACGEVIRRSGDYIQCSEGLRTCTGGKWGACVGDKVYIKGAPVRVEGKSKPLDLQGSPTSCANNPCNPDCVNYVDDPQGVDAGDGLAITDAGLTLSKQDVACIGLQCFQQTCSDGGTTTISGKVTDPAGISPIYNAYVYVPQTAVQPLTTGIATDSCGSLSGDPLVITTTGYDGTFVLGNVPVTSNVPVIIQIGKWRKKFLVNVNNCTDNVIPAADTALPTHMDSSIPENNIPYFAMAAGGCDYLECLLNRIGIDSAEFTDPSSAGRVAYYQANGGAPLASATVPFWSSLMNTTAKLSEYDVVVLGCQCGSEYNNGTVNGYRPNVVAYANAGGRVFTSHWGMQWVDAHMTDAFTPVANWAGALYGGAVTLDTYADTSTTKGQDFAYWLAAASVTNPFSTTPSRFDVRSVNTTHSVAYAYAFSDNNTSHGTPDNVPDFTFNTPVGSPPASQVGKVVFADTHVSESAVDLFQVKQFPTWCKTTGSSPLTAQEKALEYLFFDLSACIAPPTILPPSYPSTYTFDRDYEGVCPVGKGVVWRFFDWMTDTPSDTSIQFSARTADTVAGLSGATGVTLATISGAPITTWTGTDVGVKLQTIGEPSRQWLRVTMALSPSTDKAYAPTVTAWRQLYDCADNQ